MTNVGPDVFIVSFEIKDRPCLEAFLPGLHAAGVSARAIDLFEDLGRGIADNLQAFIKSPFPVAIIASVSAGDVLRRLRPAETFLCIGVEHGFAPFKGYTYDPGLLQADYYLAPSAGWAERLVRLYPSQRAKVRLGGYPKLEAMREMVAEATQDAQGKAGTGRLLVIFSWGISEAALSRLPDREWIDYLLHPGDADKVSTACLQHASVHFSRPELTPRLIAQAKMIVGDFSSLTLECIYLGKPVTFLLDRSLYTAECDCDDGFFDRESTAFGRIPHSNERISASGALSAADFTQALGEQDDLRSFAASAPAAQFPASFFPPAPGRLSGSAEILRIISEEIDRRADLTLPQPDVEKAGQVLHDLQLVTRVYQATLGRSPDIEGLLHYHGALRHAEGPSGARALTIAAQLAGSAECGERLGPEACAALAEGLRALAKSEMLCAGATPALRAIGDYIQADRWRDKRMAASTAEERLHWGLRLVAAQHADGSDYAELAGDAASLGQAETALFLIAKARSCGVNRPEFLLWEADLLGRVGRLNEALASARKAMETSPEEAKRAIDRLKALLEAELRRQTDSADPIEAAVASLELSCIEDLQGDASAVVRRLSVLAALGRADRSAYIELAHACASLDASRDALHWLGKAEDEEALDGELLRFKASLLERSGRIAEALRTALNARQAGASTLAIEEDILRLEGLRKPALGSAFKRAARIARIGFTRAQ